LPEREAWPWWFVTDLRALHPQALVESPPSFSRCGIFITTPYATFTDRRMLA
jgi:hypothetical protein